MRSLHIKKNISKGLYTGMILLDLQKAFDTVDHEMLCQTSSAMGVASVEWFRSYLSYRSQMVIFLQTFGKEHAEFLRVAFLTRYFFSTMSMT